jgi:Flp pilus assembly protein TadD
MAQADLALAAREDEVALAFYRPLAEDSAKAAEGAGIAALRLNRAEAEAYLRKAVTAAPDLWRAWDGLGVAMDRRGRWAEAGAAYSRALALRPKEPAILANSGYSMFLQHRLDEAALLLDRAAAGAPDNKTISANRDMVAVLRGRFPLSKPAGQSMDEWARRLNNAGYAAFAAGDRATAEALISRAMIASEIYYRRAAANLARVVQARP